MVRLRLSLLVMVAAFLLLGGSASSIAQTPSTQAPSTPDSSAAPALALPSDPFGEEVTLIAKPIVFIKGTATWDKAFETLVAAFKLVNGFVDRQGLKASGAPMTIYTATDDTGFQFQAAIPLAESPKDLPAGDIAVGQSPEGKALKFVHRGSYDAMDTTYDAITNFLDEKNLEAKELFIEQYLTDLVATPEDKLVVEVYVPIK